MGLRPIPPPKYFGFWYDACAAGGGYLFMSDRRVRLKMLTAVNNDRFSADEVRGFLDPAGKDRPLFH